MSEQFQEVAATRESAHDVINRAYAYAKQLLDRGEKVLVSVSSDQIPLSVQQRKFLHGAVLPQIADQVRLQDGTRYSVEAWKEYYKRRFLPPKWMVERLPGDKKPVPRRIPVSTEDLGVKAYSHFIDQVIADAATEWSVDFRFSADEREAASYTRSKNNTGAQT